MNEWGVLEGSSASSTQSFVSLSHLTVILSNIMDGFYSLKPDSSLISQNTLSPSESYRSELAEWSNRHIFTSGRAESRDSNSYAVIFAYYATQVSIQRGLSARQTDLSSTSALADNMHLETLVEVLEVMDGQVSNRL
ncbi:hypothetical protein BDW74DRAFT_164373 [Aspergillus multicolor]|uniref:uncharacterized protein n=1 Tax=Aspergillus multicolor TaxID=41759 RepID=UPI003CCDC835